MKVITAAAMALASLGSVANAAAPTATTIYTGGDILTMAGTKPAYVEALAVGGGKIVYAGTLKGAPRGKSTRVVNLGGHTLLPGFIDTHGHMVYFGKNLVDADLVGTVDVAEVLARLKVQAAKTPADAWIVGFGYSAIKLREGRTPTAAELDTVAPGRPVLIVDNSGHLGAANAAAFAAAGVTAATPNPEGGVFARDSDGKSLAGPMEETALNLVRAKRPPFTGKLADDVITGGARLWASMGQTTAQDCGLGLGNDDIAIVRNAIDKNLLPIDLYVCAKDSVTDALLASAKDVADTYAPASANAMVSRQDEIFDQAGVARSSAQQLLAARPDLDKRYINRVRLGGIKFWLDGSLDTAWFTQPFTVNPPGKTGSYSGYRQIPDAVLDAAFDRFWTSNLQINMHMNGDAAADQALSAIAKAVAKYGMRDHRPVFIHATVLRPDQIAKMRQYGAIPSFLTPSIAKAGDLADKLWGAERAAHAAPAETFRRAGLPFTFSHDAPVTPSPSILEVVDAGVNRIAASGRVIGPDERVSPYDGLRAVTSFAAFQIKEEKTKGTLEVGKLADLVILESNPLKVAPTTIKSIKVVETIKEGKTVYVATGQQAAATQDSELVDNDDAHTPAPSAPLSPTARQTLGMLQAAALRP
ncbi:amidohydrolase [Polymorphobacter arshaanensis]|uniref:Amidohydrolase n=1 Tax=Glacieibacterium arshaanense TaxID=2511025 RepID=A0A4Y9EMW8_9SPHN|nr:amidohydrolase [Polymorphobacter arshaanensis]TFU03050.1 amidohydrolase [Polymorphobacter arshaanensis]